MMIGFTQSSAPEGRVVTGLAVGRVPTVLSSHSVVIIPQLQTTYESTVISQFLSPLSPEETGKCSPGKRLRYFNTVHDVIFFKTPTLSSVSLRHFRLIVAHEIGLYHHPFRIATNKWLRSNTVVIRCRRDCLASLAMTEQMSSV